jgi:dTDP-4-dehydrorhamnose 3,5-epimerase
MEVKEISIPGCFIITPYIHTDVRGSFVKTFESVFFKENKLTTSFTEEYFTVSRKRVLRGLHFQSPPYQLVKIVYCMNGKILDAVVDLRTHSPAYSRYELLELSSDNRHMLYIPEGVAHGFYAMTHNVITAYKTTCCHSKDNDAGILWNSAGIPWPDKKPILSDRDKKLPPFPDFISPFKFNPVLP